MTESKKMIVGIVVFITLASLVCIAAFSALTGSFRGKVIAVNFLRNIPMCLFVGFIDYEIVSRFQRRYLDFSIPSIIAAILMANVLIPLLVFMLRTVCPFLFTGEQSLLRQILPIVLFNSMIMLVIEISFYNKELFEKKAQLAISEKEKAQYQFEALKNQTNPHFLFNSLNVLSSLAYKDTGKANLFAKKLSFVYRYLLMTQKLMKVPLTDELDFVKSYSYLEQIRFGDSLHINLTYDEQALSKNVVPASIQMLVENALKHNINTRESPLIIDICIGKDNVTVTNNLQLRPSVTKNRIGLDNLERQYAIHGKHIGVIKSKEMFTVILPLL